MRVLFLTASAFGLLAVASVSKGQDAAWQHAYDSAKRAFAEHRYSDADNRATRHFTKAETIYRKALTITKDLPNDDSETTATIYLDQGLLYTEQDLARDAETTYVQAISNFQNAEGTARIGLGFRNLNLAQIYEARGKFAEAEPRYQEAIAVFEQASGPNSSNVATALGDYARLLRKMDRRAEASKVNKRANEIRRKSGS